MHVGGGGRIHEASYSLVDYNRAGVPLMEIVSRPDIRSSEQARAYVSELRGVLQAVDVSDVKLEEGSMRVDANVSVRPRGTEELGVKVEVKNMNSLRSLGRAIDYEIERQVAALAAGERIVQETRHWDEADGVTHSMRTKEGSSDYRYFPEPDLVPVAPNEEMRARVRASMPELPARAPRPPRQRVGHQRRPMRAILVATPESRSVRRCGSASRSTPARRKDVVNWCIGDVLAHLNETGLSAEVLPLAPDGLAELVDLVADGTLSRGQAKDVLAECLREAKRPKQVVEERGLEQVSDEGELGAVDRRDHRGEPSRRRRVPQRRRQGPQEEAGVLHGRGDEGHQGPGQPPAPQPPPRRPPRR